MFGSVWIYVSGVVVLILYIEHESKRIRADIQSLRELIIDLHNGGAQ